MPVDYSERSQSAAPVCAVAGGSFRLGTGSGARSCPSSVGIRGREYRRHDARRVVSQPVGAGQVRDRVLPGPGDGGREGPRAWFWRETRRPKIVELAHESPDQTVILMPTHGYGPFRRFILGSNTAKVLHDADCPVWTGVHLETLSLNGESVMAKKIEKSEQPLQAVPGGISTGCRRADEALRGHRQAG